MSKANWPDDLKIQIMSLLYKIADDEGEYDGKDEWMPTCFEFDAKAILKQIGELE